MKFNTELLHKNFGGDKSTGSTLTPIYQTNAFGFENAERQEKVFAGTAPGFVYSRITNPTIDSFEKRMSAIEGGISAIGCCSGMSAVNLSLLNILQSGDEIIASSGLYGGTIDLFGDLKEFGIKTVFLEDVTAENVSNAINERTRAVFSEVIGNPKLDVIDINAVSKVCHDNGIPLIIDSTTATPYIIKPLEHGADIVVHSSSKYINGSGDAISGIIVDGGSFKYDFDKYPSLKKFEKLGKFAYTARLRTDLWSNFGTCMSPFNAWLNSIGLETLGLRMERLCSNAIELAKFLAKFDGIEVNYPGLESSKYYNLFKTELSGKGGAILTLRVGSKEKAFKLINSLKYATIASNIGDTRTLVLHPASTINVHNTSKQREMAGVYDDTIRISVGIENIEDLKEDFENAINKVL